MPFDSMPTKPDVFSLEGLIAWLETQDPATEYCYHKNGDCLLHRYFRNNGIAMPVGHGVGGTFIHTADFRRIDLSEELAAVPRCEPHTYAAALDRARALSQGRA